MFVLDFLRYFRGYVKFQAEGDFIERFLNLVARDRIPIWDGRKRGTAYTGFTDAGCYRKLRRHARKTGTRLRVLEKAGIPFQRKKYRKRTGLLVGLGIFAAFLVAMSQFIWRIEVNGLEDIAESSILQSLEAIGIKQGAFRHSIDIRDAERLAMLSMPDVSWIALNMDGSVLRVEVNERVSPPEMVDPDRPCNLIASHSGQILSIYVFEGQAVVQAGDGVAAGDVLVSGITEDRVGNNLFRHSRAEVTAQVEVDLMIETPLQQAELKETGEAKQRGYLGIFGLEFPLFLPLPLENPYRVERKQTPLRIFQLELPVYYLGETYILMEEIPVTYSEEEAKKLALQELALIEKAQLNGAEILERTAKGGLRGDSFSIEAHYICSMDIAVEREIYMEDSFVPNS